MAMTLALDQPSDSFPPRAGLRAPATGHLVHADPRPPLDAPISLTCTSALPHPAVEATAHLSSSLSNEMSIQTTLSSAVFVGAATLTAVGSNRSDAPRAATPFPFPFLQGPW
jgi:hypothetical protein